jgi:predicted metallopeptidase
VDYTAALAELCRDIVFRVPMLRHIDMSCIAVSFSQTKHAHPYGTFASITPLRFKGGAKTAERHGRLWTLPEVQTAAGTETLYIIYFFVPRFIELKLSQKLETVIHELYHISPDFNGDIRRFPGKNYAHGSSQKKYDAVVRSLSEHYLKQDPPQEFLDFLHYNYKELTARHGRLSGTRIPMPKLIPYCPSPPLT